MKNIAFIISAAIFFACNSSKKNDSGTESSSEVADSIAVSANENTKRLFDLFKKKAELPFLADTTLFKSVKDLDSLGSAEIELLTSVTLNNNEDEYELKEFFKIDSIKASGSYAKWCETLDIGMTKFANAYAISKIKLNDSTALLVWGMSSSSYEACPFFSGVNVYFTVFKNNIAGPYFKLGEYISAGDPPSLMEKTVTGSIGADGNITKDVVQQNEDMDEPFVEITKEHYSYALKNGKIELIQEKRSDPVKVSRPPQK